MQKFSEVVFSFQERVDDAILCSEEIDRHVAHLGSCEYSHETFSATLEKIQKAVDDLNLHSYSNLEQWVDALDARVSQMHTAISDLYVYCVVQLAHSGDLSALYNVGPRDTCP